LLQEARPCRQPELQRNPSEVNVMTLEGRVLNGKIVLQPPASLPEGASVRIEVLTTEAPAPTLAERLSNVIGKAKGLPSDASINMDHYLYGTPKRQ
jgi:hypothetical protein